jgi:TrpR-related protein YerC/YecD
MSKGMNDNTSIKTVNMIQQIGPYIDWKPKNKGELLDALLACQNRDEMARFLRDLMTPQEIEEFAKRFEAARMLSEDTQYNTIIERTGLSSTTVARIAKWLKGSLGGYRLVLARLSNPIANHHHNPAKLGKGLSLRT